MGINLDQSLVNNALASDFRAIGV